MKSWLGSQIEKKSLHSERDDFDIIYDNWISFITQTNMMFFTLFYIFHVIKLGALENVLSMLRIIINEFDLNSHNTSDVTRSEVRAMSQLW